MDTDNFIKIVWGVIIIAIFLANNLKRKKQTPPQEIQGDDSYEGEPQGFDLETIFREELKRHVQTKVEDEPMPIKKEANNNRVVTPQSKPIPKVEQSVEMAAKSTPKIKASKSSIARSFDLRRAVIETEILTPKFKDK